MKRLLAVAVTLALAGPWAPVQSGQPDERVLWQLFHAGKLHLLRQAIGEYRARYPDWSPPEELRRWLQQARRPRAGDGWSRRIEAAIRARNWPELIRLERLRPRRFGCRRPDFLRALARAHALAGSMATARRRYRQALACPGAPRRDILAEALWQLPPPDFRDLLAAGRGQVPPSVYAEFDYQSRRRHLLEAHRQGDWPTFERLAGTLREDAATRRDLDLIAQVGWTWYDRHRWQRALGWFRAGLGLAPENEPLALGLLLCYARLGRDEDVLALARRARGPSTRLRREAAGYLLERAWDFYRRGDDRRSRSYARQALPWLADPAAAEYLLAWVDLHSGRHASAQRRFERLYRAHPDRADYAGALVHSHLQAGADPGRLGARFPEPLMQKLLLPHRARYEYDHKRFLRAHRLSPGAFPGLDNIDSPAWGGAALYRFKSGDSGLDRLHTVLAPLSESSLVTDTRQAVFQLGLVSLRSGRLVGAGIRALQATADPLTPDLQDVLAREAQQLRRDLPTRAVEAARLGFAYRREGRLNPYFQAGLTPVGGPLAPRPTFRLGVADRLALGPTWRLAWRAEGYSQPVRQSLLSYTGWKLQGRRWGRVLRSGLQLSGSLRAGPHWGVYQALDAAFLDGQRTKDNWMLGYTLAPGYDLRPAGFDHVTLGPYFSFIHYGNNQNHFRPGHGGYFSPQAFYQGGLQLSLRTAEGGKFLLEGRLAAGVQHFRERRAPWYPRGCGPRLPLCRLNPDYPDNRETSFAPAGRFRIAWQLHPHLQLIGGAYARRTSGYREIGAGILVRFLFEPRPAVFSTDLPSLFFDAVE